MRYPMLCLVLAVSLTATAQAGLFKNEIDLADLAELPEESLEPLRETEFDVFVARVRLAGAKSAERRASGSVRTAKRALEVEELDPRAANAELKAAKANQDEERVQAAQAVLARAGGDQRAAKQLLEWKQAEQAAGEARVKQAKAHLDLAEARRDLGRVRLLADAGAPALAKHDVGELEVAARKREKKHDRAARRAEQAAAKLPALRSEWERMAQGRTPLEAEQE